MGGSEETIAFAKILKAGAGPYAMSAGDVYEGLIQAPERAGKGLKNDAKTEHYRDGKDCVNIGFHKPDFQGVACLFL